MKKSNLKKMPAIAAMLTFAGGSVAFASQLPGGISVPDISFSDFSFAGNLLHLDKLSPEAQAFAKKLGLDVSKIGESGYALDAKVAQATAAAQAAANSTKSLKKQANAAKTEASTASTDLSTRGVMQANTRIAAQLAELQVGNNATTLQIAATTAETGKVIAKMDKRATVTETLDSGGEQAFITASQRVAGKYYMNTQH
jgi:hypothetical protein